MTWLGFWPWWIGAPALAVVAVGFAVLVGRSMGVSGSFARVVDAVRAGAAADDRLVDDKEGFDAALRAATREEFGEGAVGAGCDAPSGGGGTGAMTRWTHHLFFLFMVFVGALLAAALHSGLGVQSSLGAEFTRFVGGGWQAWLVLVAGGVLVGFGTRMSGGCTSGHGLSGCARMQPGSLLATAVFFGAGVAISFLLAARVS
jgi:uncharacterized membrane protein YedE/YeeE